MPIYKYECTRCFFELQEIQKITDAEIKKVDELLKKKEGEIVEI